MEPEGQSRTKHNMQILEAGHGPPKCVMKSWLWLFAVCAFPNWLVTFMVLPTASVTHLLGDSVAHAHV